MEKNFPVEHFRKFRYACTSQSCFLFRKFPKMLFHSSLEISEIQLVLFYRIESAHFYKFSRLNFRDSLKRRSRKGQITSILE